MHRRESAPHPEGTARKNPGDSDRESLRESSFSPRQTRENRRRQDGSAIPANKGESGFHKSGCPRRFREEAGGAPLRNAEAGEFPGTNHNDARTGRRHDNKIRRRPVRRAETPERSSGRRKNAPVPAVAPASDGLSEKAEAPADPRKKTRRAADSDAKRSSRGARTRQAPSSEPHSAPGEGEALSPQKKLCPCVFRLSVRPA